MIKNINIILLFLLFFQHFNKINSNDNFNSFLISKKIEEIENEKIMKEKLIDNAIYIIRNKNGDLNLDIEGGNTPTFLDNPKKALKKHFRFISVDKNTNRPTDIITSDNYYCIEDKDNHKRIGITNLDGEIGLYPAPNNSNNGISDNCLWKIYPIIIGENSNDIVIKKIYYYIQNRANGKFLTFVDKANKKGILRCNFENKEKLTDKNYFILNRRYREKNPNESSEILEKEPIDVLIKYIDLSDPNLKREGIAQIKKDEENGEITFVVRSILKNIPWIRKIFILMPNEKVKYFKDPDEIKEKIVYVKDKDILGFDSASSPVFQFNLWKMQQFGLSENFILMDDDYFIGKPLKKSNFFYEENGEIYPALVTGDYYELRRKNLETALKPLLAKIGNIGPHTPNGFTIMQKSTLLFLFDIFGEDNNRYGQPLIEPAFSHNAIPVKQSDIKEVYDLIIKLYPYAEETLKAKIRHIRSLQPQTIFLGYPKNKYDRRVKIISSKFYDLTQFKGKIESELFVINTSDKKYASNHYSNEIKRLQALFPDKTPYEIGGPPIIKENDNNKEKNENKEKDEKKVENIEKIVKKNEKKVEKDEKKVVNDEKKVELDEKIVEKDEKIAEKDENSVKNETIAEKNENDENLVKKETSEIENNDEFYENIIEHIKNNLEEKKKYNYDLSDIKNKIKNLYDEYNKKEKEVEEIKKKYNNLIGKNETIFINRDKNDSNYKFYEILILIVILVGFILYLYYTEEFSRNNINKYSNYSDVNGFGSIGKDIELSMVNSKLIV